MADFHGVARLFALLVLFGAGLVGVLQDASAQSSGQCYSAPCYEYRSARTFGGNIGPWHPTPQAAANYVVGKNVPNGFACAFTPVLSIVEVREGSDGVWRFQYTCKPSASEPVQTSAWVVVERQGRAPDVCVPPQVVVGGQCTSPCAGLAGQAPSALTCSGADCAFFGAPEARSACLANGSSTTSGCTVAGELLIASGTRPDGSGPWVVRLKNTKFTGQPCNPSAESAPGSVPSGENGAHLESDNAGKCPGTVNGVEVWVACGQSSTEDRKSEQGSTTNPDGSTSQSDKDSVSKTLCKDGVCTTTTTTTTTINNQTTTSVNTTTTGKGAFCQSNPKDPQCGDSGGWGGSCSSGFQCSGDPVMCAAAKGVWEQKCSLVDGPATPTSEQTAYVGALDPDAEGNKLPVTDVTVSMANFDSSNSLGVAGQCIADVQVMVWNQQLTLPMSSICPHLATLGAVLLAVAWIMAAVIVGKGVTA